MTSTVNAYCVNNMHAMVSKATRHPGECWVRMDAKVAPRQQGTTVPQGKLGTPRRRL